MRETKHLHSRRMWALSFGFDFSFHVHSSGSRAVVPQGKGSKRRPPFLFPFFFFQRRENASNQAAGPQGVRRCRCETGACTSAACVGGASSGAANAAVASGALLTATTRRPALQKCCASCARDGGRTGRRPPFPNLPATLSATLHPSKCLRAKGNRVWKPPPRL